MRIKMMTKRTLSVLLMLVIFGASCAWAEVAVRLSRHGEYVTTLIVPMGDEENPQVWTPRSQRLIRRGQALNPYGDDFGDGWPVVAEEPTAERFPWVVWSRLDGGELDLAYSRWDERGWSPVNWVSIHAPGGDDVDPQIGFDGEARPYLTWWTFENGKGKVYVSVFLENDWMAPFLVSDTQVDSRYPMIEITRSSSGVNTARIAYNTPDGSVRQDVVFSLPVTITDDINPMGIVHAGDPIYVGERPAE